MILGGLTVAAVIWRLRMYDNGPNGCGRRKNTAIIILSSHSFFNMYKQFLAPSGFEC